jgi:hypothetical protein
MKLRPDAEVSLKSAIKRIAVKTPDLGTPEAQAVLLALCRKCYRLGVQEMQEEVAQELGEILDCDEDLINPTDREDDNGEQYES